MKTFNWLKAIVYGALTWGAGGIALWALTFTDLSAGWTHGLVAAVIGLTAYLFALEAKPENLSQAVGYGVVWVAIGMVLDAVITRAFDAHIFTSWQYYLGYALALLAPMVELELPATRHQAV
jgi:hypothetical protein